MIHDNIDREWELPPSLYLTFEEWRVPLSLLSNADADADADAESSEESDFFPASSNATGEIFSRKSMKL